LDVVQQGSGGAVVALEAGGDGVQFGRGGGGESVRECPSRRV
jgi:hypothetical protein